MGTKHRNTIDVTKNFLADAAVALGLTETALSIKVGHAKSWASQVKAKGHIKVHDKARVEALLAGHQLPALPKPTRASADTLAAPPPVVAEPHFVRFLVLAEPRDAAKVRMILAGSQIHFEEHE